MITALLFKIIEEAIDVENFIYNSYKTIHLFYVENFSEIILSSNLRKVVSKKVQRINGNDNY